MTAKTLSESVRYCTHLSKNVVISPFAPPGGGACMVCLNSYECGFSDCGCRNLLIRLDAGAGGEREARG